MTLEDTNENQLDLYLDGLMPQQDIADFLKTIDPDVLQRAENDQHRIDNALRRLMSFEELDQEEIVQRFLRKDLEGTRIDNRSAESRSNANRSWRQIAVAAAVLLAVTLGIWFSSGSGLVEPKFTPRALASIYSETVESGFRPYYFCEDDARFAETFKFRLGQALALTEMPANREMIGISYLGGISRSTTAMLCRVDGENVLVFVDRAGESGIEAATADVDGELNVFVTEKNGLVFCEVTPLDAAQMIEHFSFED